MALELSEGRDIDLVLTDLRMPVLDGVGLMEALRADPKRRAWPVVAVTASSLEHERAVYLVMGFTDYIPKPYEFVRILEVLRDRAGAQFVPPDTSLDEATSAAASDSALDADWLQLQAWAQDGDVAALRQWMAETHANALSESLRDEARAALARYDFDALTDLFPARPSEHHSKALNDAQPGLDQSAHRRRHAGKHRPVDFDAEPARPANFWRRTAVSALWRWPIASGPT